MNLVAVAAAAKTKTCRLSADSIRISWSLTMLPLYLYKFKALSGDPRNPAPKRVAGGGQLRFCKNAGKFTSISMAGSGDKPEPEPVESNNDRPIDSELDSRLWTPDSRRPDSRLARESRPKDTGAGGDRTFPADAGGVVGFLV